jgi:hypothetical protein
MGIWTKLTGATDAPPTGRTAKERKRRAKEISGIDRRTAGWLKAGGLAPKEWS